MSGQVKKGYARPLDIKHGRVDELASAIRLPPT